MPDKPTYEELEQKVKTLEEKYEKFELAENKLSQQRYLLQELIDSIPNPIFYKDENTVYLGCNKAFENFLGMVSSTIIGKTGYDLSPKEKADKYHEMDAALLNDSETGIQIYEYSVVDSKGNHRVAQFNKATINKIDGSLGGLVGIIFDITERKMMEEELKRSKELSETILNAIEDPVCLINVDDFSIVEANSSFLAEYQTTQNTILGNVCYDVTHQQQEPCCAPHDICPLKETVQEGKTSHSEHLHFLPDGSEAFVDIISSPIMDEKGKVIQVVHIARDITDRKKTEKEKEMLIQDLQTALEEIITLKGIEHTKNEATLKLNEQRYKKAQRIGQVGNWEYSPTTRNFWGSEEARRIFGFDHDRKDLTIDEIEKCIPDGERVHQALVDLIEKGNPYNLEFEIRSLTGPKKKYIKSIAEVVVNESGIPEKVEGVILDITDLKLTDEKLRKNEERYRQLFHSIRDSIIVADTDRNIIDFNQTFREWFGYTKEEIVGRKTSLIYESKEQFLKMGKKYKNYRNHGVKQFNYTINYKRKSGEIFPGETNAFYLENDKGETVGFIGIIRDITRRKMVDDSLQKANDELEGKTVELEDTNTALKVLLKKRDKDNLELQENIYSNYELMITPFLSKLKNRSNNRDQQNLLDIIYTNLQEIVTPFAKSLSNPMMSLTSSEIQIATMIKQGFTNKEISQTLNCSKRTIDTHRENIRKKLDLTNKKVNLKTFLSNL